MEAVRKGAAAAPLASTEVVHDAVDVRAVEGRCIVVPGALLAGGHVAAARLGKVHAARIMIVVWLHLERGALLRREWVHLEVVARDGCSLRTDAWAGRWYGPGHADHA